jgi:type I restriction enzyme S subunit
MAGKDKKPEIRFAGFTNVWERREFGELADYKKGPFGSALTKDMFVPKTSESVKVYEQQNAINRNWKLERYFVTQEYANKMNTFEVHGGDIIVSCAGTIGEIYVLPSDAEDGIINQALMRIRVDEDIVDKTLFIYLFSNMIEVFSKIHSNGSAMKNIPPFADLKPTLVYIPSKQEQYRIVTLLTNLDNLIALHQRKYDKLVIVKKSMLEKMFSKDGANVPEIRFAGFTDVWEQRKLGELMEISSATRVHKAEWTETGVPFFRSSDVVSAFKGSENDKAFISYELFEELSNKSGKVHENDLLVTGGGSIGIPYKVRNNEPLYFKDADLIWLKKSSLINSDFLYMYFITSVFRRYVGSITHIGTISHYTIEQVKATPMMIPEIKEQTHIGSFFARLDNLITLHQRELEKLKNIKKSMLKKMFV